MFFFDKINTNDLIYFSISLQDSENDNIDYIYSTALIYNYDVVGTKSFDFTEFRFRLWELYDSYSSDNNKIVIRASAYNPEFVMPSSSTFQLNINISPESS